MRYKKQKTSVADESQITTLQMIASEFRRAILSCDPGTLPVTLQRFPCGACGDAALLLVKYLEEQGFGQFDYMLGQRDDHSHAWLRRGKLIIDIAADQFTDQPASVIVTTDNSWHRSFAGEALHVADFATYGEHTVTVLNNAYQEIRKQI